MEQKNTIALGAGLIISLLVLFTVLNKGCFGKRNFSWRETYDEKSKEPYGAYVFHELLKNYFQEEDFKIIKDSLFKELPYQDSLSKKANYVFVGPAIYMDSLSNKALLSFVEKGNDAFISSKTIPYDLMYSLYYEECNDYYWDDYAVLRDSTMDVNLVHENLRADSNFVFKYKKQFTTTKYNWNYIDPNVFCEEEYSMTQLGQLQDFYPNFAKVSYGKGNFYLHTTPMSFSNFTLVEEQNLDYANKVFSHLDQGSIYYDAHSRISEGVGRRRNEQHNFFNNRTFKSENELSYILSQPALRWAWYLALGLALLFLLFRAKRQQRVIPVTEENKNTSMEFVGTIGQLYFQQSNHKQLAIQKMKLWLGFIREKYRITAKEMNEEFEKKVAARSNVDREVIHKIITQNNIIQNATGIHEHTLIEFHGNMERFYGDCR